jgi:hypothetical protein
MLVAECQICLRREPINPDRKLWWQSRPYCITCEVDFADALARLVTGDPHAEAVAQKLWQWEVRRD